MICVVVVSSSLPPSKGRETEVEGIGYVDGVVVAVVVVGGAVWRTSVAMFFPQSHFLSLSFWCLVSYVAMGFATTSLLSLHVAVPSATKGSAVVAVSVFLVAHLEAVCPSGSTRGGE